MDPISVTCASCGTLNAANRKFCMECGNRLEISCAACGTANPPGTKFCGECGTAMAGDATSATGPATTAAQAAVPEATAERRLVSVLFADLVGFTTFSEGRDAEETRELLTRYFEIARGIIERHGGTIEKFIGDAVMAVWGAPTAHEDDAERAVRAALELVGAVPAIGETEGVAQIQARAGVLTGEAAVTLGAQHQGMVAGDLVNTASRLQSVAAPGTVLVGETTYRAASTAIAFEPAGDHSLKGKASPVPAWRAMAVVARRGGQGRAATLEPPFVGRDEELRILKDLLDTTSREGKSRLATVIGQAGIGKTRLTWEFEKYLDGVVDTVYWLQGRSPAYGEGISYWALVEMVRQRAGIAEADDSATARPKLMATLDEFITDADERRWIEPRIAGLLGLEELPTEGREELFAAWRTLFERIAAVAPAVLVFTDLQWADQGMLDFIEDLLRWARTSPILVIAQARPELLERRPDFGSSVRSATRITLEPLSDPEMRALLEGLVPGLPPAALKQIVERAEGIPLYAVETVRMLLDRELLIADDGGYHLAEDLPELGVPETLQALIASRLDANQPEDRALLQDASVLGQSFTVEALAAVAGVDAATLSDRLDRLVLRQLLIVEVDPRSPERGQYQFVQAVVREVAYASLAKPDRRARHLAAARYLEGLGDEETAGVLASHYLLAHEASRPGPEADALAAQARITLQAAAERAAALHSHQQAIGYYEQALTVTSDPADQALLHLRASESGEVADREVGRQHAAAALELYRSLADVHGSLRAATWLGRHETSRRTESKAITTLEAAIAEAASIADSAEYAAALAELSRAYMLMARNTEAIATADRALELSSRHGLSRAIVEALINKGTALMTIGRAVESEAVLRGAMAIADRQGMITASMRARNNLTGMYADDDLREGVALIREGYALAVRFGSRPFMHYFLISLASFSIATGDWGAWLDEIEAAEEAEGLPPFHQSSLSGVRSQLAALRGDDERVDAERRIAHAVAAELESRAVTSELSLYDAYAAFWRGDWAAAVRDALGASDDINAATEGRATAAHAAIAGDLDDDLAQILEALRTSPIRVRMSIAATANAEGGLAARDGRWDEARVGYRQALELRRQAGHLLEEALTGLEWGALAGGRDPEAAAAAAAAEAFFAERGGEKAVERYRAAFVPVKERASTEAEQATTAHPTPPRTGVPSS